MVDSFNPQHCSDMPTWAVPEWRWFSFTHSLRGRSAPDDNDGLGSGHAECMRGGSLLMRSIQATFGWKLSASRCAAWQLKGHLDLSSVVRVRWQQIFGDGEDDGCSCLRQLLT